MKCNRLYRTVAVLFMTLLSALAGEDHALQTNSLPVETLFSSGRYEASLTGGALFSPFIATHGRPTIDYSITEVQFGYMLDNVQEAGWLRGNFELLGEAFGSSVFTGEGNYISGITAWLRYNVVPANWRFIPYAQAGLGLTFTDIDRNVLGETFNFNLNLGIGARYFVARNWSVNLEYRYQHISNADLARRNLGINAHGPVFGLSLFF